MTRFKKKKGKLLNWQEYDWQEYVTVTTAFNTKNNFTYMLTD